LILEAFSAYLKFVAFHVPGCWAEMKDASMPLASSTIFMRYPDALSEARGFPFPLQPMINDFP
jgi:hypothetical protein